MTKIEKVKVSELNPEDDLQKSWLFGYKEDATENKESVQFSLEKILVNNHLETITKSSPTDYVYDTDKLGGERQTTFRVTSHTGKIKLVDKHPNADVPTVGAFLVINESALPLTIDLFGSSKYLRSAETIKVPAGKSAQVLFRKYSNGIGVFMAQVVEGKEIDWDGLLPDEYRRGRVDSVRLVMDVTKGYSDDYLFNPIDWSTPEMKRGDFAAGDYDIQEVDEYWWFRRPVCVDYGKPHEDKSTTPGWFDWLRYTSEKVADWTNGTMSFYEFQKEFGGYFYQETKGCWEWLPMYEYQFDTWAIWKPRVSKFRNQSNARTLNPVLTSEYVREDIRVWTTPDKNAVYQLMGQAPNGGESSLVKRVMNFIGGDTTKLPFDVPYNRYKDISGLSFWNLGSNAANPGEVSSYGFGQLSILAIGERDDFTGVNNLQRLNLISGQVNENNAIKYQDQIVINSRADSSQLRYCSRKTDTEIGYRMFVNEAKDSVDMFDYKATAIWEEISADGQVVRKVDLSDGVRLLFKTSYKETPDDKKVVRLLDASQNLVKAIQFAGPSDDSIISGSIDLTKYPTAKYAVIPYATSASSSGTNKQFKATVELQDYSSQDNLVPLNPGMERGVALRYTNREHRRVLKKWSEIKAEASEMKGQIVMG